MVQLVTRLSKGAPLTHAEMDNNLIELDTGIGNLDTTVQAYIADNNTVVAYKVARSELAEVAFSGDYADLINVPQLADAKWTLFEPKL